MNVLLDASGGATNILPVNMYGVTGLSQGYYNNIIPWIFDFGTSTVPSGPGYMDVQVMTMDLYLGVSAGGALTMAFIDGTAASSAFAVNLGQPNWSGDLALTTEYCTLTYFLDGHPVTPL